MTRRFRVVITDFIDDDLTPEREILGDIAYIEALAAEHEPQLAGRIESADAVMMYHFLKIGAQTLARLDRCRLVVRCGVGFDNVDIHAAAKLGIPVANVPDYGTEEVADSALGLLLSLTRGIALLDGRLKAQRGRWHYSEAAPLRRLRGRVCGVVGCGRIGTAFVQRAKALGMDVRFYDPYVVDGLDKALGITRCETLDSLLQVSDVVSLHCFLSEETRHLIDQRAVDQMKPGAYLVNTARGAVVDPAAVLYGIRSGRLAGVGLDVLAQEPPDDDSPLLRAWRDPHDPVHDRLILNPHAAFYSEEGLMDMRTKGSHNIRRALLGERIRNVVNGIPVRHLP